MNQEQLNDLTNNIAKQVYPDIAGKGVGILILAVNRETDFSVSSLQIEDAKLPTLLKTVGKKIQGMPVDHIEF